MKQCLLGCAVAFALITPTVPCSAADPAGLSGSVPEGVVRATLSNGLRVVVVPDRLAPVVTTELNYLAGSNDAPDGFPAALQVTLGGDLPDRGTVRPGKEDAQPAVGVI